MHCFLFLLVNDCFILLLLLSVVWRYSTEQFSRSISVDLSVYSFLVHILVGFVMHVSMTIKSVYIDEKQKKKDEESIHPINKSSSISEGEDFTD